MNNFSRRVYVLLSLICLVLSNSVYGDEYWEGEDKTNWKDPRYRDEDLSHTKIKVLTKRVRGLYYYAYEITNPIENKGTMSGFRLDISCDLDFSQVDYPPVTPTMDQSNGKHVPVGAVDIHGNEASVMTNFLEPGNKYAFFMVSPAPPAEREFKVAPYVDNYGWRYDLYPDGKGVVDFIHRGTTLGPECTTEFGPEIEWLGSQEEPFGINQLLAYAEPISDELLAYDSNDAVTITVFYHSGIDVGSFKAKADGKDISNLFHPSPDTYETVTIQTGNWNNNSRIHLSVLGVVTDKNKGNNQFKSIDNDVFKITFKRYRAIKLNKIEK